MEFLRYDPADADALVEFMCGERWPFHAGVPTPASVRAGDFSNAYWIVDDTVRVGLVRPYDLDDETAMFDLRVRGAYRGKGVGTRAVGWLTDHVFAHHAHVTRIEGTTRQDNIAMRRAFLRNGYAKEAHYRQAWPSPEGGVYDAVGYAVLRGDRAAGTVTPVRWDDEPVTR